MKRQWRLTGVDEMVLALSARGLTHHLRAPAEVRGASASRCTISTIADRATDGVSEPSPGPGRLQGKVIVSIR